MNPDDFDKLTSAIFLGFIRGDVGKNGRKRKTRLNWRGKRVKVSKGMVSRLVLWAFLINPIIEQERMRNEYRHWVNAKKAKRAAMPARMPARVPAKATTANAYGSKPMKKLRTCESFCGCPTGRCREVCRWYCIGNCVEYDDNDNPLCQCPMI